MSAWALSMTVIFIVITMAVSIWQKLGLERDIAIGTIRSAVQLLLVGYVLQFVFHTDHPALIVLIVAIMITVATLNASQKSAVLKGIRIRIAVSLAATEILIMGVLIGLHVIEATPRYIIPISGMTVGSAMVVASLFLNQMNREVQSMRGEIETLLALGATTRQAIHDSLKRAVKASMIPTIDGMKTVGLVQLPGMMTGMIVAGANPVEAVRYQILIVFALATSSAVTSLVLAMLSYKLWFTRDARLR